MGKSRYHVSRSACRSRALKCPRQGFKEVLFFLLTALPPQFLRKIEYRRPLTHPPTPLPPLPPPRSRLRLEQFESTNESTNKWAVITFNRISPDSFVLPLSPALDAVQSEIPFTIRSMQRTRYFTYSSLDSEIHYGEDPNTDQLRRRSWGNRVAVDGSLFPRPG